MSLRSLFGFGENRKKVRNYLERGAEVIDLRTVVDFNQEPIRNARNICLDELDQYQDLIRELAPVVICCQTGFRSDEVAVLLKKEGIDSINGGSRKRVRKIIDEKDGSRKV